MTIVCEASDPYYLLQRQTSFAGLNNAVEAFCFAGDLLASILHRRHCVILEKGFQNKHFSGGFITKKGKELEQGSLRRSVHR